MKKQKSQVEKNVSTSFGYVKKDILMLNDNLSELHNKFQQFLSQYEILLDEIKELKASLNKKPTKKAPTKKTTAKKKKTTKTKTSKKKENKKSPKKLYLDYNLLGE